MAEEILKMKNINKEFPGVKALLDVDFSLIKGEVHVLIGENGAGKSTLIKILSGAYTADSGEIFIDKKIVKNVNPTDAIRNGISVIYQEFNLNPFMKIYENVFLGREYKTPLGFIDIGKAIDETSKLIKMVGLNASPNTFVRKLSVAQQQLVEIAKAMSLNAKIYVFDEPTASLAENEIKMLFSTIWKLKNKGCGIIFISHRLNELFEIGDRCTVLRDGQYVGTRDINNLKIDELIKMVVGRKITDTKRKQTYSIPETALQVDNLSWRDKLTNVSFKLKKGEILGVAGLMGSGRTELAKCIIGEYKKNSGRILIYGNEINNKCVSESKKNGIVYLSEDRKKEGLFLQHPVLTNVTISALEKVARLIFLRLNKEKRDYITMRDRLKVKAPNIKTLVRDLSGGNQQKVVIAKWLFTESEIFIFDEPTRGIDVGAKNEIHKIMEELVKAGASIIMISSEFPEILKMSDRVMVMRLGEVQAILNNDNLTQEDIFHYAIGSHKMSIEN
jgi:ribose transport system ATP-binding protein